LPKDKWALLFTRYAACSSIRSFIQIEKEALSTRERMSYSIANNVNHEDYTELSSLIRYLKQKPVFG